MEVFKKCFLMLSSTQLGLLQLDLVRFNHTITKCLALITIYLVHCSTCTDLKALDNEITLRLDILSNPQELIHLPLWRPKQTDASSSIHLRSPSENKYTNNRKWKLSLSLLEMDCYDGDFLSIKSEGTSLQVNVCENKSLNLTNSKNDAASFFVLIASGVSSIDIEVKGRWDFSSAVLLATIYYETNEDCDCAYNFICCKSPPQHQFQNSNPEHRKISEFKNEGATRSNICIQRNRFHSSSNYALSCTSFEDRKEFLEMSSTNHVSALLEDPVTVVNECDDDECDGITIMEYALMVIGILAALGFIGIFFGCYQYRKKNDWNIKRETSTRILQSRYPVPMIFEDLQLEEKQQQHEQKEPTAPAHNKTPAKNHGVSKGYKREVILCFEDI